MADEKNTDHDLLIKIATQVERLILDVADIKTNTVGRVEKLEINKAERCDIEKVTNRITSLENWRRYVIGIATVVSIVAGFVVPKL